MANLVQELLIKIGLKADTAQGQQVADTVKGIGSGAKQAGAGLADSARSSKDLAQELGKTVAVGSATKEFLGAVRDVGKGGAESLFAMGRAAISFGNIVKTTLVTSGPIGWAIAALGTLAAAVIALKDAFVPAGETAEEMGRRLAELNKAQLDRVTAEQKGLAEAAAEAVAAIDKELAAMNKLADMRTARLIEEEKARGKAAGTPAEVTERNITRIRRDAEDAKIGRELGAAEAKARTLEDAAGEAELRRIDADTKRSMLLGLKATFDDLDKQEGEMRRRMLKGYFKRGYALPEENERLAALQRERDEARAALEKRLGGRDKDGALYKDAQKTADEVLRTATEASQTATKAAEAARKAADDARKLEGDLRPERKGLQAAEDENAREYSEAEKAKIAAARKKAQERMEWRMRELGPASVAERIASGDTAFDIATARAMFPRHKFTGPTGSAGSRVPAGDGVYLPGERMPGPVVAPQNQVTFGGLKPGSDTKDGAVARALKDTATATEEADTGAGTAEQAEQLKEVTEKHAAAVKESAQKTDAAMADASRALAAASGVLSTHNGRLGNHDAEFRRVWGAISALQSSRAA